MALVSGRSMEPRLPHGAWILVWPQGSLAARVGEVVVLEHPSRPGFELVKRVEALSQERRLLWVAGDNRLASSDSQDFGPVALERLRGRVLLRLSPLPPALIRRRGRHGPDRRDPTARSASCHHYP